jgi:hypothetical protein
MYYVITKQRKDKQNEHRNQLLQGIQHQGTTNEDGTVNVETWWNENTTGAWWNGTEHAQGKFNTRKEYLKWLTDKFAEIIGE